MKLFRTVLVSAAIYGVYKFMKELNQQQNTIVNEEIPDWLETARLNQEMLQNGNLSPEM